VGSAPPYPDRPRREQLLDLLFPPLCVGCRRVGRWICDRCWPHVEWLDPADRTRRRAGSPLESITAVTNFTGSAREAVHALKYEGHHAISGLMGRLMAEAVSDTDAIVVHAALHRSRRRERGYDQSAMLADVIASAGRLRRDNALLRTRRTEQQASLDRDRRADNVRGAFMARQDLTGKTIILVDDVSTTGATLEAAAEALRAAGAARVRGLVFARAT